VKQQWQKQHAAATAGKSGPWSKKPLRDVNSQYLRHYMASADLLLSHEYGVNRNSGGAAASA
jgi:hypothetical protein